MGVISTGSTRRIQWWWSKGGKEGSEGGREGKRTYLARRPWSIEEARAG